MRITERKLRSIIKSVIKETYDDREHDDGGENLYGIDDLGDETDRFQVPEEEEWVSDDEYSEESWDEDLDPDVYDNTDDGMGPWD